MKHVFDIDFWRGILGSVITVVTPELEFLGEIGRFLGVCAGLVLVFYSIKHKILEIKKLKEK